MKKKNWLITLLLSAAISCGGLALSSCYTLSAPDSSVSETEQSILEVYAQYVIHAQAQGETPLTYEAWLASIKGEKGDQGDKGDTGETGKSAYEIWLDNGHTGNEEAFLEWLKGEKGDQGNQGDKGDQGDKGETGKSAYEIWLENGHTGNEEAFLEWLKGEKGDQGNQGDKGDQGVSVVKIEIDENGNFVFYFSDGTSQVVTIPSTLHTHSYALVDTVAPTCTTQGYDNMKCIGCDSTYQTNFTDMFDHAWETEYSWNNTFHWYGCQNCDAVNDKTEHTAGDDNLCTTCQTPVGATEGILYDLSVDKTYAEVIGYEGTATRIRIADTYEGVPVTGVAQKAFYDKENITQVIIPDSVKTIGAYAFRYCSNLTNVVIGNSVTKIGEYAFESCSNLTRIAMGNSVTQIGASAFYYCSNLTDIYITDIATWCNISGLYSLTAPWGDIKNIYLNNKLLTELIIPDGVTTIRASAFKYCSNFTSVVISDSVITIEEEAFATCTNLTSVVIGDSVTTIGSSAFNGCNNLTNVVLPDSVTTIAGSAFSNCNKLQFNEYANCKYLGTANNPYHALIKVTNENFSSYAIHENTKVIASYAFYNCTRIVSIIIPDSVISIGEYVFTYCSNLTSIVIGNSVSSIGIKTFYDCTKLATVYYKGTTSDWWNIEIGNNNSELSRATRYYYSEERPTEEGNYWHYDENGEIVVW